MAQMQKSGKVFVLVTKQNVGTTTGTFPNKTVVLSGKGIDSGADFGTTLTIKAGTRGRDPNNATIGFSGGINYQAIDDGGDVDPDPDDKSGNGNGTDDKSGETTPKVVTLGFKGTISGVSDLTPYVNMSINFLDGRGFIDIKNVAKSIQVDDDTTATLRVSVSGEAAVSNVAITPLGKGVVLQTPTGKSFEEDESPKDFNITIADGNTLAATNMAVKVTVARITTGEEDNRDDDSKFPGG